MINKIKNYFKPVKTQPSIEVKIGMNIEFNYYGMVHNGVIIKEFNGSYKETKEHVLVKVRSPGSWLRAEEIIYFSIHPNDVIRTYYGSALERALYG